jgi:hypothetical protein
MAINYTYGDLDFRGGQAKNVCLDNFTALPASPSCGQFGIFNSKLSFWDGTAWQTLPASSAGSAQVPANTVFVSPNYTNIYPYFSTLTAAIAGSAAGDKIIVYAGTYVEDISLNYRNWFFMPNTIINGNSTASAAFNTTIKGNCKFSKLTLAYAAGDNYEFELAGILILQYSYCNIKANIISDLTITYSLGLVSIDAFEVGTINMQYCDYLAYFNFQKLSGAVIITQAKAIMQFENSIYNSGLQFSISSGLDTKRAYLKIIDAKLPEDYNNSTAAILINGYSDIELQHVSIYNHGSASLYNDCIYIDGTILNSHKLKLDNCLLFGFPVNAKIAYQNIYNINSVSVVNPRGSINTLWESIKTYSDLW